MKITITIANKIAECSDTWDEFLPDSHHLKSRHLASLERACINNIESNYLQVYNKDQLVGLVYLQQFMFTHEHLNFEQPPAVVSAALNFLLPKQLPILVCGNLFRVDFQGFYFKDPARPTLALEAIKLYLEQNKNYKPSGVILKDCETVLVEESYKPFGFTFFNGDVTMELARRPHWQTFDDYLADLNKNYLQRARKIIRAFQKIKIREFDAPAILAGTAEIEKLYWNVVNKQAIKLGTVNAAYFYELKMDLAHKFEFHALYLDQKMVGFYTLIFYQTTMETHYIGLDYDTNQEAKLYFNILFLSTKKMIEGKYASLELGRTAREAKVNLGAMPKQIFNYIKVKNPLVKLTLQYFLNRFSKASSHHLVDRNPLK